METKNTDKGSKVALIKAEINKQIGDADTLKSLINTTFTNKGVPMSPELVKRALLEGMLRGFSFEDFLNQNVYAIPFGDTFSLVTSIDYSRKIGARSGIVGVDAPVYKEDGDRIISCSVTVHKRFTDGYVGAFTAEPDFKEYSTSKNLWASKPKTMISKVAEMHALRKACPEELAQAYVEEEIQREVTAVPSIDLTTHEAALRACKTKEELERVWADMPMDAKMKLSDVLAQMKAIIQDATKDIV